jgi:hypothetical protein
MAIQFIQNDIQKMKNRILDVEQQTNQATALVPPHLSHDIEELDATTRSMSDSLRSFDGATIRSKLDRSDDTFRYLADRVTAHLDDDPNYAPTERYVTSFLDDIGTRILATTKERISNFQFCLDRRLQALSFRNRQTDSLFLTQPPILETPRPRIVYKFVPRCEAASLVALKAIKEQTERLRGLYEQVEQLKSRRVDLGDPCDFDALFETAAVEHRSLLGHKLRTDAINSQLRLLERGAKFAADSQEIDLTDYVKKSEVQEYSDKVTRMMTEVNEAWDGARDEVQTEMANLKGRIELLEERLAQFGDFSGESNDLLAYLAVRVDVLLSATPNTLEREKARIRHKRFIEGFIRTNQLVGEASHEALVADLRRKLRDRQASRPLVKA